MMSPEQSAASMTGHLWTQKEAAAAIKVSVSYLRASTCPKMFLPSLKPNGRPMVRYVPAEVEAWYRQFHSDRKWAA
jgi:hypothetical protein